MPLTAEQVTELESKRNRYGCGWFACQDCYPIEYACGLCGADYPAPIANGETFECVECGYIANEPGQP